MISDYYQMCVAVMNEWLTRNILANPNFCRDDRTITWNKRESVFTRGNIGLQDLLKLVQRKQYSFQLVNGGGLIQLHYRFSADGRTVTAANLAYYGIARKNSPATQNPRVEDSEDSDWGVYDDVSAEYYAWLDQGQDVSWIRIDYDPDAGAGILHSECHLHLSGFPYGRIAVDSVPNPRQFVDLVLAFCSPADFATCRLDDENRLLDEPAIRTLNQGSQAAGDHDLCKYISHLSVPNL